MTKEAILQQQVCDYIKLRHPGVIFHSDFAAGMKLPIWLASRNKRLQSSRGFPDLFVAAPHGGFHGLFIELKHPSSGEILKSGLMGNGAHVQEQRSMLEQLRKEGYRAEFGIGFDNTIKMIDNYLRLAKF